MVVGADGCFTAITRPVVIGLQVFATARSVEGIQDLADLGVKTLGLDVTDNDAVFRVRDQVAEIAGGKLDILVNNAYDFLSFPSYPPDVYPPMNVQGTTYVAGSPLRS